MIQIYLGKIGETTELQISPLTSVILYSTPMQYVLFL